jgi:putative transposase
MLIYREGRMMLRIS